jgi:hypothetical protein
MAKRIGIVGQVQGRVPKKTCPARKWTKRAGIIAFLFFLGKGLLWLGLLAVGTYYTLH